MKPLRWLGVGVAVVMIAASTLAFPRYLGPTRSGSAVRQAESILQACEAYRLHPASGNKYPAKLADLHKPPFGGESYLRNGEADLIDPWNTPYRYAVLTGSDGEQEAYVWGEQMIEGKLRLYGGKLRPEGRIERFGLEE
jgi:hypothetical protein